MEILPKWSENLTAVTVNDFTSQSGPTVPISDCPLEVFKLFFNKDLQEKIVKETNRYAREVMGDEKYEQWKEIDEECFLGLLWGLFSYSVTISGRLLE